MDERTTAKNDVLEKYLCTRKAKETETIREHTDNLKERAEYLFQDGYITDPHLYQMLLQVCEYHDYGKLNKEFQTRLSRKYKYNPDKEIYHQILSVYFLPKDIFETEEDYLMAVFVVLYHHYRNQNPLNFMYEEEDRIREALEEFADCLEPEVWDLAEEYSGEIRQFIQSIDSFVIKLKGLLHKCDYSASAGIPCEIKNDFLEEKLQKFLTEKLHCKGYSWNALQQFCLANREENLIVTAPTGMGKTEAGLLWLGNRKGFFVLPLRTAINAMYDRIAEELVETDVDNKIGLLHSDMQSYYMGKGFYEQQEENFFTYCNKSRQLSLPLTVCTLDQIFDFVYKYPGYEYKLATLSYSGIIIDEIQMYDPELLAYLVYGMKLIHDMGGKIAVVTATLPPFARARIAEALNEDFKEADFSSEGNIRHNATVYDEVLTADKVWEHWGTFKKRKQKNKLLVICNSIDTAQQMYRDLQTICEENGEAVPIHLLHSKFTKAHRKEKEAAILKAGQTFDSTGEFLEVNEIWISTSVVEASLDIDFDYLITELMDIFSLFQRFGRCNRKGKKPVDLPNCFVYTTLQGNAEKYKFVDETIYELSKQAVHEMSGILAEEKKNALIVEYLSEEKLASSEYRIKYDTIYQHIEDLYAYLKTSEDNKLRNIESAEIIPEVVYEENKTDIQTWEATIADDNSSWGERLQAMNQIRQCCVSVSRYYDAPNKAGNKVASVRLGRYEEIPVMKCEYDEEIGFAGMETLKPESKPKESQSGVIV